MLRVTVTGGRGEGKTVTAIRIARFLRLFGFQVSYRARTKGHTATINRIIDRGLPIAGIDTKEIEVIDIQ